MADLTVGTSSECITCGGVIVWESDLRYRERMQLPIDPERRHYYSAKRWNHYAPDDHAHPHHCPDAFQSESTLQSKWGYKVAQAKGFCIEKLTSDRSDRYNEPCNTRVVDEDLHMCGIHASKEREEIRRRERIQAQRDQENFFEQWIENVFVPRLKELGFGDNIYVSTYSRGSGKVVINAEPFIDWLNRLEAVNADSNC